MSRRVPSYAVTGGMSWDSRSATQASNKPNPSTGACICCFTSITTDSKNVLLGCKKEGEVPIHERRTRRINNNATDNDAQQHAQTMTVYAPIVHTRGRDSSQPADYQISQLTPHAPPHTITHHHLPPLIAHRPPWGSGVHHLQLLCLTSKFCCAMDTKPMAVGLVKVPW